MTPRLAVAAALLCLVALPALAEGDAREGRRLAQQWCTSCHVVGINTRGPDTAPPFAALASDPLRTETYLKTWIANPHPPMPNFNLGRGEIDDLVAYIRSLGADGTRIQR